MKLMHPESLQEIDVADNRVEMYAAQGWRPLSSDAPAADALVDAWRSYAVANGFTAAEVAGMDAQSLRAALA